MSAVLERKKVDRILNPQRFGLAEYKRNIWHVVAELGTEPDDVMVPAYWAHVAEQFKPFDEIRVTIDDGAWVLYLLVTSCDRNWAKVFKLAFHELMDDMSAPAKSIRHEVAWKGPHLKWCVVRVSDGAKVSEGHADKTAAAAWMSEHERAIE